MSLLSFPPVEIAEPSGRQLRDAEDVQSRLFEWRGRPLFPLTPDRWALFRSLRTLAGADQLLEAGTADESAVVESGRADLDAAILLWLLAHDHAEWESNRRIEIRGRMVTVAPLERSFSAMREQIRIWANENIALAEMTVAAALVKEVVELSFRAFPEAKKDGPDDDKKKETEPAPVGCPII
jgi:hypothetical protein